MNINAQNLDYYQLNQAIRQAEGPVVIDHCLGQRFIGTALGAGRSLTIHGVPGNAMGAYLDGGSIEVFGDVQEATGDIEGDVGYRAGIHMKSYGSKVPVLVVGGAAGSFLGEYQAGGLILVLGLGHEDRAPYNYFCGTGMHGGKIVVRSDYIPENLPDQVVPHDLDQAGLEEIMPHLERYCSTFGVPMERILPHRFYALTPNTASPYKRLYAMN